MAERPLKTNRDALLAAIRKPRSRREKTRFLSVEEVVDRTLEAVDAFARPHLENEWTGGEVLHQLRIWRKGRE